MLSCEIALFIRLPPTPSSLILFRFGLPHRSFACFFYRCLCVLPADQGDSDSSSPLPAHLTNIGFISGTYRVEHAASILFFVTSITGCPRIILLVQYIQTFTTRNTTHCTYTFDTTPRRAIRNYGPPEVGYDI